MFFLRISILCTLIALGAQCHAQTGINEKKSLVVDASIGRGLLGPSIGMVAILLNNPQYRAIGEVNVTNPVSSSTGPFSFRAEYRAIKWLSVGVEGIWSKHTISSDEVYGALANGGAGVGDLSMTTTRPGAGLRLGIHLGKNHAFLDPYLMGTLGIRRQNLVSVSSTTLLTNGLVSTNLPWVRGGMGLRFITPVGIGGNVELGIGGPLISGGLSYRIPTGK